LESQSIEFVLPSDVAHWQLDKMDATDIRVPVLIGYAATGAHKANDSKPFAHTVSSGFPWQMREHIIEHVQAALPACSAAALVFQVPWEADLAISLNDMEKRFDSLAYRCQVNVRLANSNPAVANFDDAAIATRIKDSQRLVANLSNVDLILDTFMDVDRGYSPRHGLIDRHCNFRAAGLSLTQNKL